MRAFRHREIVHKLIDNRVASLTHERVVKVRRRGGRNEKRNRGPAIGAQKRYRRPLAAISHLVGNTTEGLMVGERKQPPGRSLPRIYASGEWCFDAVKSIREKHEVSAIENKLKLVPSQL